MNPGSARPAVTVQKATRAPGLPGAAQLRRWVGAALVADSASGPLVQPAQVTLRFVGEREGRRLNRQFRGKDYATNVLTFVYQRRPLWGDVVLCQPVIRREAETQGAGLQAHQAHLVVHGLLHLQGYDHENRRDAEVMERREAEILGALGYSDPYRVYRG